MRIVVTMAKTPSENASSRLRDRHVRARRALRESDPWDSGPVSSSVLIHAAMISDRAETYPGRRRQSPVPRTYSGGAKTQLSGFFGENATGIS